MTQVIESCQGMLTVGYRAGLRSAQACFTTRRADNDLIGGLSPSRSIARPASMERWRSRVALVTGASSGIGASIASSLVKHGLNVVGCARNVERIQALAAELKGEPGQLVPTHCDLRREADIMAMFEKIRSDFGMLDICVNNAGLGHEASILDGTMENWREMLEVNVLAVCLCTREAVKLMREKGVNDGHIINLNSVSGHQLQPGPGRDKMNIYAASKFSITAITEGTRRELRSFNSHIRVTQISPGVVNSEFRERMFKDRERAEKEIASLETVLTTQDIADCVLFAIQCPTHMQVHDILLRPTTQVS